MEPMIPDGSLALFRARDNALAAYAAGLIDLDPWRRFVVRDRDTVERAMSTMGIVPAEAEPDW
ncbi:MAG: hypothetical protein ACR2KP_04680 [Egibacteraceae bacterium]|jgi:hypothetical protein